MVPAKKKEIEHLAVECGACGVYVNAPLRGQFDYFDDLKMFAPERVCLLECPRCVSPILFKQEMDFDGDWEGGVVIYPSRKRSLGQAVPRTIRRAFSEAFTCYKSDAYTACALMCRKCLEGICKESGGTKKNLAVMLDELKAKNVIDARLHEWATALRVLGNEAAHGVEAEFDKHDAEDALDFTEAIAEYVFTFRVRFDQFKKRQGGKAKKVSPRRVRSQKGRD